MAFRISSSSKRRDCIIKECSVPHMKRHRLPHPFIDIDRFTAWLELAGRLDLLERDCLKVYHNQRICLGHFSMDCFLPNYNRLRPDALPDSNLPEPSALPFAEVADPQPTDASVEVVVTPVMFGERQPESVVEPVSITPDSQVHHHSNTSKEELKSYRKGPRQPWLYSEVHAKAVEEKKKRLENLSCEEITDVLLKDKTEDTENKNVQQSDTSPSKPHFIQVLGEQNFQDPTVIKSVLDKVKLKKKGSVFVVPVKKDCNLTRDNLEKIIEELPTEDSKVKEKLLSLVRSKSLGKNKQIPKVKQRRISKWSSSSRVSKRGRKRKAKVSPALKVTFQGSSIPVNSCQSSDDDKFANIFTVSTILTDVNDKSQIEQLCQLLIKSLFTVKNVNIAGTMSKIEIYLMQSSEINNENNGRENVVELAEHSKTSENENETGVVETLEERYNGTSPMLEVSECVEIPFLDNTACINSVPQAEQSPLHANANITFRHDHAYLSAERKAFFEKPPYLVNIINIDRDKPNRSKTIPNGGLYKKLSKKYQNLCVKHSRQITRLKDFLKKKNDYIENIKCKVKYLRDILCEEFGVKHVRYPQVNKVQVDGENHLEQDYENYPREEDKNAQSELDKAVQSIYPTSDSRETARRKRKKDGFILTADFVVPPKQLCVEDFENSVETTETDFETRFNHFYNTFINNE